ncbi:MAG: VPDSG-CTERM sorting domain-containing protein [Verrucomicrobiota bacterium]|jgi:hypothetical protein
MKQTLKTIPAICAAALCAVALAGPGAKANSIPTITGSIGFGASGVTINTPDLASATSFAVSGPFVTISHGTYSAVPEFYSDVTFNGFTFHPPVGSITPLWTFDIGSTVYSFDATTDSSTWNPSLDSWEIGGDGIAMITGYAPTLGTWNVNLSETRASFVFDSSAGASGVAVPDGGSTMALLGGGLLGLGLFSRKFCC